MMPGTASRNTKTELVKNVADHERFHFQSSIDLSRFEDIVKGTYIKGQTVHDFFLAYA
jgi:hypothetical protein